jgi:hypothetical protein
VIGCWLLHLWWVMSQAIGQVVLVMSQWMSQNEHDD